MQMKIKAMWCVLLLCCAGAMAQAAQPLTVYLVRHAEKQDDGTRDPDLSEAGQVRAGNLAVLLSRAGIQHVFSTEYRRTQQTAAPLAAQLGLTVQPYNPRDLHAFAQQLLKLQGPVLVVGHSNTTPQLAQLLSAEPVEGLSEQAYDRLYQVTVNGPHRHLHRWVLLPRSEE